MINYTKSMGRDRTDATNNKTSFLIGTYTVLFVIALFMTVMNVMTKKGILTYCTAVFAGLCVVNVMLVLLGGAFKQASKLLFALEVVAMFTFFLVSGNPDGFSALWICMLPSLGMFFFDKVRGTGICAMMFLILIFFLWTPSGGQLLMYQYNDTFRMRYPVLFVAFHVMAFIVETQRERAYKELHKLQMYYEEQSMHDSLTGLYNRHGMYRAMEKAIAITGEQGLGVAMFDLDFFKEINDTYGHEAGDNVLKYFADVLTENLDAVVCRWGGEEFVAIFYGERVTAENLENIRDTMENHIFPVDKEKIFSVTVSIGVLESGDADAGSLDKLISMADTALYQAKNEGRNKIVYYNK